jgi:hypothetical protein
MSSVHVAPIAWYWKFFLLQYIEALCQSRLFKADHAYLIYLMLQSSLVTWRVVSMTATKFKPHIFCVWRCLALCCEHDFVWRLLVACTILYNRTHTEGLKPDSNYFCWSSLYSLSTDRIENIAFMVPLLFRVYSLPRKLVYSAVA